MNANKIQIAVIEKAMSIGFEIEESARIDSAYEASYQYLMMEVPDDDKKIVIGEMTNNHSHLYAKADDGTEFECDGEIVSTSTEKGDVIGDFADSNGDIWLVKFGGWED